MGTHVVTCFLRRRGRVLLGRRSDAVGTYVGRWGAISGYAEGDPATAARREIDEEVGLLDAISPVRSGDPIEVVDGERTWIVHPYLFDCGPGRPTPNWEFDTVEWVHPSEIRHRETVPSLWEAYDAVAPTVETVREDETHGSAYISIRALEVLRDAAAHLEGLDDGSRTGGGWDELAELARALLDARPSMAALANRINRTMYEADERTASEVQSTARERIERAVDADERAATRAAETIDGAVLTLSRSGTVETALIEAEPDRVIVLESRPDREGIGVAERLTSAGIDTMITLDAAVAHVVGDVDYLLVGADTVLADASVVNKVGTRTAAIAADREGAAVYAVGAVDKISPATELTPETVSREAIYEDGSDLTVDCPLFDRTPTDLVSGVITEIGVLGPEEIAEHAAERERWAGWADDSMPANE